MSDQPKQTQLEFFRTIVPNLASRSAANFTRYLDLLRNYSIGESVWSDDLSRDTRLTLYNRSDKSCKNSETVVPIIALACPSSTLALLGGWIRESRSSDLLHPIPDMDADAPNVFVLQATAMHDYISGSFEGVEYVVDPWD